MMYFINIFDKTTEKQWKEEFYSYYLFKKSKKLLITSHSNL